MSKRIISVFAVASLAALAACGNGNKTENTSADTTAVPGVDTVMQPTTVPVTDTVVTESTTTTTQDTIHGSAADTATTRP